MMHDVDIFGVGEKLRETVRPGGEVRIAQGGTTRTPGTPSFDDVNVGDELPVHHTRLSRGDLVNYAGVAGDANPIHWDEDIAKLAGLPDVIATGCSPWAWAPASRPAGRATRCGHPLRGAVVRAGDRVSRRRLRHRVQRPDQVARPGDAQRRRHRRRQVGRQRSSAWQRWRCGFAELVVSDSRTRRSKSAKPLRIACCCSAESRSQWVARPP